MYAARETTNPKKDKYELRLTNEPEEWSLKWRRKASLLIILELGPTKVNSYALNNPPSNHEP